MEYNKCERITKKLDIAHKEYGKNRIFLVGNNLNDLFLRDIRDGVYSLKKHFEFYVLDNEEFNWFVYIKGEDKVQYYEKVNGRLEARNKDDFSKKTISGLGGKFSKKNKKENNNQVSEKQNSEQNTAEENVKDNLEDASIYRLLEELIDENKSNKHADKRVFVFFENFDWYAQLYNSENNVRIIGYIQKIEKLKDHLIVFSLKQLKVLEEKYFEEYDDKEIITVGKPSMTEIQLSLHRISWIEGYGNLPNLKYETVASQFVKNSSTLRECINIFKNKLKIHKKNLSLEHFEFKTKVEEKITWDDIVLEKEKKNKIQRIVRKFKEENILQRKGMLFTGPPGTGKTYIAKAIAQQEKIYFMCPKLSDLKGEYVGQSAPKIKKMFEEARMYQPTLIFLDEIDTLFPARSSEEGDSYTKDITNEFLQQLDGVDTGYQKVFVLGATNRIEAIDSAVRSRLGEPIEIGLPDREERKRLLSKELLEKLPKLFWQNLSKENEKELLDKTEGMSGRDIKNFATNFKENRNNLDANQFYISEFRRAFSERKETLLFELKKNTGLNCNLPANIETIELFGIENSYETLERVMEQIKKKEREKREFYKLNFQNGILLYGPPGNGKTELVEQVCKNKNMIFIKVESKDIVGYNSRDTLMNLDNIFSHALQLSKICDEDEGVVLFFDEFDSLAGRSMTSSVRGTLLGKLADKHGIRTQESKLIIVAATNFFNEIDEAVKRTGRFDIHLELDNPSKQVALEILKSLFKSEKISIIENEELIDKGEESLVSKFYEIIKRKEFFKREKETILELEKRELNIEQIKKEMLENHRVSCSYLKNMVTDLKRILIETITVEKNDSFDKNLKFTDKTLEKFRKRIGASDE